MPFRSKAQQRFMFATMPDTAREWAHETKNMKKLPEHVRHRKHAFFTAFRQELIEKHAGVLGFLAKRPFAALQAGMFGAATMPAAYEGFQRGMSGEKTRYLQASKYGPSDSFSQNFHEALPHDADWGERRRMSLHYNRRALGGA
jgi:hypothetical protein